MKTLYVGNIPFKSSENDLKKFFEPHGKVHSVKLIKERATGKSRGFGFIEMDEAGAKTALAFLNNAKFCGRNLRIDEAKERTNRYPRPNRRPAGPNFSQTKQMGI